MASTNKTPHLGLCQWVETDPFLREDMNGDFARIDEAFGNLPRVKLFDITVTEAVSLIQIDFTGIDLTPYAELEMFFDFTEDEKYMRFNEYTESKYIFVTPSEAQFTDRIKVTYGISRIGISYRAFIYKCDALHRFERMFRSYFPELNTIELFSEGSSNKFVAGDHITVWGVRR